ncbi:MAG: hypothetical protein J7639_04120 [Paenibacillaceae bacterium]|nr:hypothetical protein [Paenibacillaceae bacterium]
METVLLAPGHAEAVNRRRRIVVQNDLMGEIMELFGCDPGKLLEIAFHFVDEPGSQIDSIVWDIDYFLPKDGVTANAGIRKWREQGIDIVALLLKEARKRGLESIWNHRIAEVDFGANGVGLGLETKSRRKVEHPDWVVRSWWWQGLWNLASPGLREYKLHYLRDVAERYEIDGIQLDFSRHVPCLPVGQQWEHRAHATAFVEMVRRMLLEVEAAQGRPLLLAAKVPENLEGCRIDGLDVAAWAEQRLVDIYTLGSRTIDVDIAAFRRITEGRNIKLYPCHDDHHATDGYRYPPIEFFRGVFGNWRQQGADGVGTFNWASATVDVYASGGAKRYAGGPPSQRQAYREVGGMDTMRFKDKTFVVQRRGGYPWAEGYFNRNDHAALPAVLPNDGRSLELTLAVCDDVASLTDRVTQATLLLVLYGASSGDRLEIAVNGVVVDIDGFDREWKDPQIFSPKPQPASGGNGLYTTDPEQRLCAAALSPSPGLFKPGVNRIDVRVAERGVYRPGQNIVLEKLELGIKYIPETADTGRGG